MAQPIHTRMTWSDYQQLPEDGNRYEVLEGTLMMSPAPGFRHQCVSMNLSYLVERWRRDSGAGGRVLTAPFDVVLSDDVILQPDLVYISGIQHGRHRWRAFVWRPPIWRLKSFGRPGPREIAWPSCSSTQSSECGNTGLLIWTPAR